MELSGKTGESKAFGARGKSGSGGQLRLPRIEIIATPRERERKRGSLTMVNIVSTTVIGTAEQKRERKRIAVTRAFN